MSRTNEIQFLYTDNANRPTTKWTVITFLLGAYALSCAFLVFFLAGRSLPVTMPEEATENVVEDPRPELEVPDFTNITVISERKDAFFGFLAPLAEWENRQVLQDRKRILAIKAELEKNGKISPKSKRKITALVKDYRFEDAELSVAEQIDTLLRRVDTIPISMILAQAATESAWGTSRFAVEGNNYFGQWCFRKGCGLVPLQRGDNQQHEVASFGTAMDSVRSYIRNINTHLAYRDLRTMRATLRATGGVVEGLELIKGLESYSERGMDYVSELALIIRGNQLNQLDQLLQNEG